MNINIPNSLSLKILYHWGFLNISTYYYYVKLLKIIIITSYILVKIMLVYLVKVFYLVKIMVTSVVKKR
jgi:hypothetical protein